MDVSAGTLKDISLWDKDYVAGLPRGEFDWLEYKASEKLTDPAWTHDMSKYVSAWANYDGGYIIFGLKNPDDEGRPLIIDGGIPGSLKPNLSDWLDDVIPRLVEPPLQKLTTWLIHPKREGSQIKPGHVLVAVHIPQSEIAPHQALDHKYYQRVGRRLEPLKHRANPRHHRSPPLSQTPHYDLNSHRRWLNETVYVLEA
jgi:predicted HTH transcriptional regulator